jgi:hypothetical protein
VRRLGYAGAVSAGRFVAPCVAALLCAELASAQVVTENAGVTSPELTILREVATVSRSENLDELRWSHQLLFAPDRANELRLTLPVVWREARFEGAGGELESHEHGLGDASVRFKRALARSDDVMRSRRWALLLELGAPTGDDDAKEEGVRLPRTLQLGTGDWSLGAGSAYTWIDDRQRVSLEAFYRHRTRHEGIQLGATAELNAAYWYRFVPAAFGTHDSGPEIRGVLELLGSHTFASEVGDDSADDEGGIVWLAPGIHVYPAASVLLEANVQLPLFQDLDDDLGDRHWSANVVLKLLF